MLFGISSASEVFQQRIHELNERLQGVEVVAEDYVVVGFGDTGQEVPPMCHKGSQAKQRQDQIETTQSALHRTHSH